jgi:NhaP-type Na+/H+ or K+/H+ antiporter
MQRDKLIRRLRQLYVVEFMNVFWLPLAFWIMGRVSNEEFGLNSIVAMTVNGILLMEGSYLWLCISRQLRLKKQHDFTQIFRVLKVLNFGFFTLAIITISLTPFSGTFDRIVTILFILLAVLEHINYFEVQLMYDNQNDKKYLTQYKRLKEAKLKKIMKIRSLTKSLPPT